MYDLYLKIFEYLSLPKWIGVISWPVIPFIGIAALMVLMVLFLVLLERKFLALLTIRKGPNRVGPNGLFQTVADAIKLLFKEDIIPTNANKILFTIAPVVFFFPVMTVYGLIPFAHNWVAINASCGLILMLAISSISVLGLLSAGWASNNKYSMLGAMRSVAQAISYELPLVLSALSVVVLSGTMNLDKIAFGQENIFGWYIFPAFLGFVIFLICTLAELNRVPFDLPEAESELVSGYNTEYSGMKFALFFLAEYAA
ncbi:MAG: complex I subunit 1 family protein, partial [bacterium]